MPATLELTERPIPRDGGTYALILQLYAGRLLQVGKLGAFNFPAGHYIYIGSALGPGGLAGRLGRHVAPVKPDSRLHWHVDYLRRWTTIAEVWFAEHSVQHEHDWAVIAGRLPGSIVPAPRFGASDCRCPSHLFHFEDAPIAERFQASLGLLFPADRPLSVIRMGERTER
ncbi:MAG: GIY-YIG nuclease family protein [Chloroflexota bacterium]|nr:MAG: GIY-YIG nuclease family protein [Chloroflexota bacterium]